MELVSWSVKFSNCFMRTDGQTEEVRQECECTLVEIVIKWTCVLLILIQRRFFGPAHGVGSKATFICRLVAPVTSDVLCRGMPAYLAVVDSLS
jgi:hypothetical protein